MELTLDGDYRVPGKYAGQVGIDVDDFGSLAPRATATITHSSTTPISPKSSSGWGTPIFRPRALPSVARSTSGPASGRYKTQLVNAYVLSAIFLNIFREHKLVMTRPAISLIVMPKS